SSPRWWRGRSSPKAWTPWPGGRGSSWRWSSPGSRGLGSKVGAEGRHAGGHAGRTAGGGGHPRVLRRGAPARRREGPGGRRPAAACTRPFAKPRIALLMCPADPAGRKVSSLGQGFHTSYVTCLGDTTATPPEDPRGLNRSGMFFGLSRVSLGDVTDGAANTAM